MKEILYFLCTQKWKKITKHIIRLYIEATRRRRYAAFLLYVQKNVIIYLFPHYYIMSHVSFIF
jgi:hypothetical protein